MIVIAPGSVLLTAEEYRAFLVPRICPKCMLAEQKELLAKRAEAIRAAEAVFAQGAPLQEKR